MFIENVVTFKKNVGTFIENARTFIENMGTFIENVVRFKGKRLLFALLQNDNDNKICQCVVTNEHSSSGCDRF